MTLSSTIAREIGPNSDDELVARIAQAVLSRYVVLSQRDYEVLVSRAATVPLTPPPPLPPT